jgi:hypothetical protein
MSTHNNNGDANPDMFGGSKPRKRNRAKALRDRVVRVIEAHNTWADFFIKKNSRHAGRHQVLLWAVTETGDVRGMVALNWELTFADEFKTDGIEVAYRVFQNEVSAERDHFKQLKEKQAVLNKQLANQKSPRNKT